MFLTIILFILFFLCGYAIGLASSQKNNFAKPAENNQVSYVEETKKKNDIKKEFSEIIIDESKFATKVNTDSFSKDFDSLGTGLVKEDNIEQSISKLSSLKIKNKSGEKI